MTSRQTSVGIFWALASSSESASTSASPMNLKISLARCSPMATSRAAAFWMPLRPDFVVGSGTASAVLIWLVLRHPRLDLRGDALGLALHQLVELMQAGVREARRQHGRRRVLQRAARRALLELSERHRLLDLGQPARRAQVLAL